MAGGDKMYRKLAMYEDSFAEDDSFDGSKALIKNIEFIEQIGTKTISNIFGYEKFKFISKETNLSKDGKLTSNIHQAHIIAQNILQIILKEASDYLINKQKYAVLSTSNAELINNLGLNEDNEEAKNFSWIKTLIKNELCFSFPTKNINSMVVFSSNHYTDFVKEFIDIVLWCPLNICSAPRDKSRADYPGKHPDFEVIKSITTNKKYTKDVHYSEMIKVFKDSWILLWLDYKNVSIEGETLTVSEFKSQKEWLDALNVFLNNYGARLIKTKNYYIKGLIDTYIECRKNNSPLKEQNDALIDILKAKYNEEDIATVIGKSVLLALEEVQKFTNSKQNWKDTATKIKKHIEKECKAYISSFINTCCETLTYLKNSNKPLGYYAFDWKMTILYGNPIYLPHKESPLYSSDRKRIIGTTNKARIKHKNLSELTAIERLQSVIIFPEANPNGIDIEQHHKTALKEQEEKN